MNTKENIRFEVDEEFPFMMDRQIGSLVQRGLGSKTPKSHSWKLRKNTHKQNK